MENRIPKIDVALMMHGRPDLVQSDIQTDLPSAYSIVDNQVKVALSDGNENHPVFLCDSIAAHQKNKSNGLYFESEKVYGFGTINESQWFHIPNSSMVQVDQSVMGKVEEISVVTYNIWFETFYRKERY